MKLLRTVQLDTSDTFIFRTAAAPNEWAVTGAFAFFSTDIATLDNKERAAFRAGFLGIQSLGWSTLTQVVEAMAPEREAAVTLLASHLVKHFGAPDSATARMFAEEEIDLAASLCTHPVGTVIAMDRGNEGGAIRETFRALRQRGNRRPPRALTFLESTDEDEHALDLAALARVAPRGGGAV